MGVMQGHVTLVITSLLITDCAQLTGPPKVEYVIEECTTHFFYDEIEKTNRITHETQD